AHRAIRVPLGRMRKSAHFPRALARGVTAGGRAPRTSLDAAAGLFETSRMGNRFALCVLGGWAACAALASAAAAGPRDPLYQWTDAHGAVRYTSNLERIPLEQRSAAVVIAAGRTDARAAEKPAAEKPAAEKPAAEA